MIGGYKKQSSRFNLFIRVFIGDIEFYMKVYKEIKGNKKFQNIFYLYFMMGEDYIYCGFLCGV